jgi:DNA-binding SARP family transcriptional activator/streptogramin lyase
VRVRILGPLEVTEDDRVLSVGGPKERAVLAMLAAHSGIAISDERLIDALWGNEPPRTAKKTLQNYVRRLRHVLSAGPADPHVSIEYRGRGYVLRANADTIDAECASRLVDAARAAVASGDLELADSIYAEALALWRGPPLAEFGAAMGLGPTVARLEELRAAALEEHIDCALALGQHGRRIGELESLVVELPFRERLWEQLMIALYRAGRQGEALRAYQRARALLAEELGIEPRATLRQLERAILEQDPALDLRPADASTAPPPVKGRVLGADRGSPRRVRSGRPRMLVGAAILAVALGFGAVALTNVGGRAVTSAAPGGVTYFEAGSRRVGATIPIGDQPNAVLLAHDSLWVADETGGTVTRIDTKRRSAIATVGVRGTPVALAPAPDGVWVANEFEGSVVRIDRATDRVVAQIQLPVGLRGVAVEAGAVWVANGIQGTLMRVDPKSGAITKTIKVGAEPGSLASFGSDLWVANRRDHTVARVHTANGEIAAVVGLSFSPGSIAVDATGVWVTDPLGDSVVRIDPRLNTVANTVQVGIDPTGVALSRDSVWVTTSRGAIVEIDARRSLVIHRISVKYRVSSVAVDSSGVWVGIDRQ